MNLLIESAIETELRGGGGRGGGNLSCELALKSLVIQSD